MGFLGFCYKKLHFVCIIINAFSKVLRLRLPVNDFRFFSAATAFRINVHL